MKLTYRLLRARVRRAAARLRLAMFPFTSLIMIVF